MFFLKTVVLSLILVTAVAVDDEGLDEPDSIEIPIKDVAGLGVRGLRSLEPDLLIYRDTPEKIKKYSTPEGMEEMRRLSRKSLVRPIQKAIYERSQKKNAIAGKGFAVPGSNRDALPEVYRVAVKGEAPRKRIDSSKDVSLVFFTYPTTPTVVIEGIERSGINVNVSYSLRQQPRPMQRSVLLLIPCGKLPPAKYQVNILRVPATKTGHLTDKLPPVREGLEDKIVCKSFSFLVHDHGEELPTISNEAPSTQ